MKLGIPLEDYTFEVKEIIESATEKWAIPEILYKYKLHDLKTAFDILNKTGQQYQKTKMILSILEIRKCAELIKNRPLVAEEGYYPDYRSYICSPDFKIESLKLALKELEKENKEPEKQKFIRKEISIRNKGTSKSCQIIGGKLRKEWEDMRKAAAKRKESES
ncbi:Uncharacterised protein [uncultured Eubacterium sp.]|nr:Uncharacterised protein [uncultured Eubacterium sp.]